MAEMSILQETSLQFVSWFPRELVIYDLMKKVSKSKKVEFAIILTDYHAGIGVQYANVFIENKNVDLEINTISKALSQLGVIKENHQDEFDTLGLSKYSVNPDYLEKYRDMADELGI